MLVYVLAQTLTDNLLLYSYQQWESKQDFYEHIKSKAVEPLAEYVKDKVRRLLHMLRRQTTAAAALQIAHIGPHSADGMPSCTHLGHATVSYTHHPRKKHSRKTKAICFAST